MHVMVAGILHLWEKSYNIFNSSHFSTGYRKLQVSETILNAAVSGNVLPSYLLFGHTMQVVSTVAFIKYHDLMSMIQMMFFVLNGVNTFILNVMYCSGAGKIYRKSLVYLKGLKGKVKGKMERKLVMSYAPIKVRFWDNFMDELTPLIIQQN